VIPENTSRGSRTLAGADLFRVQYVVLGVIFRVGGPFSAIRYGLPAADGNTCYHRCYEDSKSELRSFQTCPLRIYVLLHNPDVCLLQTVPKHQICCTRIFCEIRGSIQKFPD
jgi:hypothetical protein